MALQMTPDNCYKIFRGDKTQTRRDHLPHNLKRHLVKHFPAWTDESIFDMEGSYSTTIELNLSILNRILNEHPYSECVIPGRGKPAAMWRGDALIQPLQACRVQFQLIEIVMKLACCFINLNHCLV